MAIGNLSVHAGGDHLGRLSPSTKGFDDGFFCEAINQPCLFLWRTVSETELDEVLDLIFLP